MALNYNVRYPNQTEVDLVNMPFGKAINVSNIDAENGTPFERDYINDQWAFFQKMLVESGQTPTGIVDNVNSSQYYNALTQIITNTTYADTESLVAGIATRVDNLDGGLSDANLLLTSTIDDLGQVSSRAFLNVSDTVDGKTEVTGLTIDSQTNGISFKGDVFELTNQAGNSALYYNANDATWIFNGRLVIGGDYNIDSVDDIRAQDGIDGQSIAALFSFPFTNSVDEWQTFGVTTTITPSYLGTICDDVAGYIHRENLNFSGAEDNIIAVRMRSNSGATSVKMDAYYKTGSHGWGEDFKKTLTSVNLRDGVWETIIFDMRDLTAGDSDWIDNNITGVRLDLYDTIGQDFDIDNISIGHYGAAATVVTYTWIKYADDADGNGISDSPIGKSYIGLAYNKSTQVESDIQTDYTWSLIKGTDGVDGDTGYTWIAYSDFSDGTDLYQLPTDDTLYIGIAVNKQTAVESSDKTDYTWSKFRGDQGVAGADGSSGTDGETGAGFYGSTYDVIDWDTATANARFTTLVGRAPVEYDIFTQARSDGADSQSRSYKNGVWVNPELLVNGDIIATGTIAGDRIIAGSVNGNTIDSKTTITAGEGEQVARLTGGDTVWRISAGASTPENAPFRVDRDGNLFAESGTFEGTVYAKEVVGEIASGAIVPYTGFSKSYPTSETSFVETYTVARFSVEPVISGGVIMPSTINTGNIGSVDWVVNGRGYDKTNNYSRKVTATLLNETTGERYVKVIQDETFDGHGGFTDRVSSVIPNLVLNVADTKCNYSVQVKVEWSLNYGTRDTSTVSLISGNMVVTRIVDTDTIRPLFV